MRLLVSSLLYDVRIFVTSSFIVHDFLGILFLTSNDLPYLHDIKGEWCLRTPWYWSLSHWSILLKFIAPIIEVGDLWHAQCNLKPSKQRDSSLFNFISDLKALFQYGRKVPVSRLNITKIIPIYPLVSSNSELDFQEKGKFLSTNILYRSCTIYFIWWINSPIKVDCASF